MDVFEDVVSHFTARAARYDRSSRWCTDPALTRAVVSTLQPSPQDEVLDVACGTGLVARALRPLTRRVVGLDLTPAMYEQCRNAVDDLVPGSAEAMPFEDDRFDLSICRQGIQFMDAPRAVAEMVRVTKPGGRICLINLCAYGEQDRDLYFEILALRNPARRNFFVREDLDALLRKAGCRHAKVHDYISREDVDLWADNGAISDDNRQRIRELYDSAPASFLELHAVSQDDGSRFFDDMLFGIAVGVK